MEVFNLDTYRFENIDMYPLREGLSLEQFSAILDVFLTIPALLSSGHIKLDAIAARQIIAAAKKARLRSTEPQKAAA